MPWPWALLILCGGATALPMPEETAYTSVAFGPPYFPLSDEQAAGYKLSHAPGTHFDLTADHAESLEKSHPDFHNEERGPIYDAHYSSVVNDAGEQNHEGLALAGAMVFIPGAFCIVAMCLAPRMVDAWAKEEDAGKSTKRPKLAQPGWRTPRNQEEGGKEPPKSVQTPRTLRSYDKRTGTPRGEPPSFRESGAGSTVRMMGRTKPAEDFVDFIDHKDIARVKWAATKVQTAQRGVIARKLVREIREAHRKHKSEDFVPVICFMWSDHLGDGSGNEQNQIKQHMRELKHGVEGQARETHKEVTGKLQKLQDVKVSNLNISHLKQSMEGQAKTVRQLSHRMAAKMEEGDVGGFDFKAGARAEAKRQRQIAKDRGGVREQLEAVGLRTHIRVSRDGSKFFLKIEGDEKWYLTMAEKLKIRVRLSKEYGSCITEYDRRLHPIMANTPDNFKKKYHDYKFTEPDSPDYNHSPTEFCPLTLVDKANIIDKILRLRKKKGGCEMVPEDMVLHETYDQYFAVHDYQICKALYKQQSNFSKSAWWKMWVIPTNEDDRQGDQTGRYQALNAMQSYFGEKVAFYFVFMDHCCFWMGLLATLGVLGLVLRILYGIDHPYLPFMAASYILWFTLFQRFWERKEQEYCLNWEVEDFKKTEEVRVQFHGEEVTSKNGHRHYIMDNSHHRIARNILTAVVLGLFFVIAIFSNVGVQVLSSLSIEDDSIPDWMSKGAPIINGLLIAILNSLYWMAASRMNNFQNYEKESEYDDALIVKVFFFQFINCFCSLFYIAFVKPWKPVVFGFQDHCIADGCMAELSGQLTGMFLTMFFVDTTVEVLLPTLMGWLTLQFQKFSIQRKKWGASEEEKKRLDAMDYSKVKMSTEMMEAVKPEYPGDLTELNQMFMNLGYTSFFGVCFPLAPLISYMIIFMQISGDSYKLTNIYKKPRVQTQDGIGSFSSLLSLMQNVNILTQVAIVCFTSEVATEGMSKVEKMIIFVLVQYFTLIFATAVAGQFDVVTQAMKIDKIERDFAEEATIEDFIKASQVKLPEKGEGLQDQHHQSLDIMDVRLEAM